MDAPSPSAERALLSAVMEAYVATHSRAASLLFLRKVAEILAARDVRDSVLVCLHRPDRIGRMEETRANKLATAMFKLMLEGCVARLAEDGSEEIVADMAT